jgi:hypothetical protein
MSKNSRCWFKLVVIIVCVRNFIFDFLLQVRHFLWVVCVVDNVKVAGYVLFHDLIYLCFYNLRCWFKFVIIIVHDCKFVSDRGISCERKKLSRWWQTFIPEPCYITKNISYYLLLWYFNADAERCYVVLSTINPLKFNGHLHIYWAT